MYAIQYSVIWAYVLRAYGNVFGHKMSFFSSLPLFASVSLFFFHSLPIMLHPLSLHLRINFTDFKLICSNLGNSIGLWIYLDCLLYTLRCVLSHENQFNEHFSSSAMSSLYFRLSLSLYPHTYTNTQAHTKQEKKLVSIPRNEQ